jgi:antitoxin component YwqK of YwqJK toxin-antitoxin module
VKKLTLLLILGLISNLAFSQTFKILNGDTVNFTNEANIKQGLWIYYFDNSEIINNKGYFKDNLKTGVWTSYYSSGKIKSEISHVANRKDGHAKIYYENGIIAEEGTWRVNKWVGAYKSYFPSRKVSYEWNYNENGERTGMQKYYHENGKVKIEGEWDKGKEKGVIKEFYETGDLKSEKLFADGQIDNSTVKNYNQNQTNSNNNNQNNTENNTNNSNTNNNSNNNNNAEIGVFSGNGYHTFYNKFRLVEKEGVFQNGYLIDGKQYIYNEEGKLIVTKTFEKGKVISSVANE